MSDESSGAGQTNALPPRDGFSGHPMTAATTVAPPGERSPLRYSVSADGGSRSSGGAGTQQIVITSRGIPTLTNAQTTSVATVAVGQQQGGGISSGGGGMTRIISLTPSRAHSNLRPSVANQNIVNALTKSRPIARTHLCQQTSNTSTELSLAQHTTTAVAGTMLRTASVKRSASTAGLDDHRGDGGYTSSGSVRLMHGAAVKRSSSIMLEQDQRGTTDSYAMKVRRLIDHRNVRSKIVQEKYNEHLMEKYYLETSGNLLDLPHFAKRPRTQHYLNYLKEHAINLKGPIAGDEPVDYKPDVPSSIGSGGDSGSALASSTSHQQSNSGLSASVVTITTAQGSIVPEIKVASSGGGGSHHPKSRVSSTSSSSFSGNNQEQIMEKAKQEAYVVQRINDLQKDGLWSERRLPKVQEMPRCKAHWDFLLEEMVWLAADFAQERKWKKAAAKKCAKMVQKYFQDKALAAQRAEKAQEQHLRRVAAFCAKEIKAFWSNIEKVVDFKQQQRLEAKRKKALDQHLSFIVDQTEKYSQLLAEGMNKSVGTSNVDAMSVPSSIAPSRNNSDDEFKPEDDSSDDEETIAQEEAKTDARGQGEEVAALQKESEMDLDTFLSKLPKDYLQNRDKINLSDTNDDSDDGDGKNDDDAGQRVSVDINDKDFVANSGSDEDDEDTIQEQEMTESKLDHKDELNDLKAENEMSVEELRKKYSNLPLLPAEPPVTQGDELSNDEEEDDEDELKSSNDDDEDDEVDNNSTSISDEEEDENKDVGLKLLLEDSDSAQNEGDLKTDKQDLIDDAAAIAESIQPKGNTLSSTSVVTPIPFLLKYTLREYQHIGLDWLVTMFERKLNGILADEMGLGKTIQTIALLAHLAVEKGNWGPHLIIVPTSVMLNWEMECKKWCPAFKILTYYGTQKERKQKRMGWTKPNAFHVCITSYKLVIQDHQSFRRKKWKYLILDEAQNIKNFKSQRWQLLLNFTTQQRLLLTGTPLQNNLMELWSLMHFLMPHVFQSHREFKEWFSNPVTGMIEGNSEYNENIIKRLHKVLRPFLLRRLKSEVEKQMPRKYEHVVMCRLSKRQRYLYDDYMSRAKTRETLATGNLLSVINVLMQLRKVCNHPNLFEVRPTTSPFQCDGINWHIPSIVYAALKYDVWKHVDLYSMNFNLVMMELYLSAYQCYRMKQYQTPKKLIEEIASTAKDDSPPFCPPSKLNMRVHKDTGKQVATTTDSKVSSEISDNNSIHPKIEAKSGGVGQTQTNLKLKIASHPNMLHFVHQSPLKVVSHSTENIVLQPRLAQIVQTSSGKHIIITPATNQNMSNNNSGSGNVTASGGGTGQRVTLLPSSKQPLSNAVQGSALTRGGARNQSATPAAVSSISNLLKVEENKETGKKIVGHKFIERLYSNQTNNTTDVRWKSSSHKPDKKNSSSHHDSSGNGEEIQIKDYYRNKLDLIARVNERRCSAVPLYGKDFHDSVKVYKSSTEPVWGAGRIHCLNALFKIRGVETTHCLEDMLYTPEKRIEQLKEIFDRFIFYVPSVQASEPQLQVWHPDSSTYWGEKETLKTLTQHFSKPATCLHSIASAMITQFPDPRLIQYDCGKLQTLNLLLRKLKAGAHRVLIFTQMTKMLDVLEAFLNFHGHIYLRLDGSTKVDQRQILMERFNGNPKIFAFILSTRSGGVGVNLTGADTVIFYDSDWNPTMDAQAQDRCHRIGQTRDVHIYRLVSERTIEENILKKANQKRLLGDLAIEGGNFTTAYFKSSTIQDLFNIDSNEETAAGRMEEVVTLNREREKAMTTTTATIETSSATYSEEKAAMGALEQALTACEDVQDVTAARTAKAEAVADLAEFDENIPLEEQQEKEKEPEVIRAEQEVENLINQLTPIERYAMRFIEETEAAWSEEQLAAAEREIDEKKREWEQNRLAALREEEERRARELEEEQDLLTYSREDATNQIWLSDNTMEQMPMWCPPTPPHQDTDVYYVDHTLDFFYNPSIMTESQLPPVYVKKELKRTRQEVGLVDSRRTPVKVSRKEDVASVPRSLFERPTPALMRMRRDMKMQKYRNIVRPSSVSSLHGGVASVKIPGSTSVSSASSKPITEMPTWHAWTINEDMAILRVVQAVQGLPVGLTVVSPGQFPNWDLVADYVNTISLTYRSPKQCRQRYDNVIQLREEGKQIFDTSSRKKKTKGNSSPLRIPTPTKSNRPYRTSELHAQDNSSTYNQLLIQRQDSFALLGAKRTPPPKAVVNPPLLKNPKHAAVLSECGVDLDHPMMAYDVGIRRAERITREKKNSIAEQQLAQRMLMKAANQLNQGATAAVANVQPSSVAQQLVTSSSTVLSVQSPVSQQSQIVTVSQAPTAAAVTSAVATIVTAAAPNTPAGGQIRTQQRIITSQQLQGQNVVSVSSLASAQLQAAAATQRLIVSGTPGQTKTTIGTATIAGKPLSPAQFQMLRQVTMQKQQQQLRLQAAAAAGGLVQQGVKTTTVTLSGQTAVQVQFTQAQSSRPQFLKQGTFTVSNKQGVARPVAEVDISQLIKRQQIQQKVLNNASIAGGSSQATSVQSLSPQVLAQAIQASSSGTQQVGTLVKTVSSSGVTQTMTIPVSGVTIGGNPVKATLAPGSIKASTPQTMRALQLQQQLLIQKKGNPKSAAGITQVAGKGGPIATQFILGSKPIATSTLMMHQFQQVIKSPLGVQQGPVVLAKAPPRVIPVNAGGQPGTKQTIQVVAASQGLAATIRPQASSALAGALAGIKVQGAAGTSQSQQVLLSQVSAALQSQAVRQNSPVRIQTTSGTPIVAVSVQTPVTGAGGAAVTAGGGGSIVVQTSGGGAAPSSQQVERADQVSRYLKK